MRISPAEPGPGDTPVPSVQADRRHSGASQFDYRTGVRHSPRSGHRATAQKLASAPAGPSRQGLSVASAVAGVLRVSRRARRRRGRPPPSTHLSRRPGQLTQRPPHTAPAGHANALSNTTDISGEFGAREAPRFGDGVLAQERHVVHASQDAAVSRPGEHNPPRDRAAPDGRHDRAHARAKVTSDRTKAAWAGRARTFTVLPGQHPQRGWPG